MKITLVPRITSDYGAIDSAHPTPHTGIDAAVPFGSPIYAPEGGIISRITDYGDTSLGKAVFVKTKAGYQYIFGHLSNNNVMHEGERVHAGDLIGYSGSTGNSTGPHLHLGLVNKAGSFIDPAQASGGDHLGILGKVLEKAYNNAHQSVQESVRSLAYDTALGFFKGVGDLIIDLSYSIALVGGGLAIILYIAGWRDGARWAGMLTVGYTLIKFLAAGG